MRTILIIVLVVAAAVAGVWAYVERPWLSPCEQLERRCEAGRASGDTRMGMFCGYFQLLRGSQTQADCQKHVEAVDKYRRGKW